MEIEIVTFVIKESAKLTDPTDWQEQIQVDIGLRGVQDNKIQDLFKPILGPRRSIKCTTSQRNEKSKQ